MLAARSAAPRVHAPTCDGLSPLCCAFGSCKDGKRRRPMPASSGSLDACRAPGHSSSESWPSAEEGTREAPVRAINPQSRPAGGASCRKSQRGWSSFLAGSVGTCCAQCLGLFSSPPCSALAATCRSGAAPLQGLHSMCCAGRVRPRKSRSRYAFGRFRSARTPSGAGLARRAGYRAARDARVHGADVGHVFRSDGSSDHAPDIPATPERAPRYDPAEVLCRICGARD